jgi:hypothetical protein
MIQAPRAQSLPVPSMVSPKLATPGDIGQAPNKALPEFSSPESSSSMTKKEKKKALLKAALESLNDSDDEDDAASEASSTPQKPLPAYFEDSQGYSQLNFPGLEDL